MSKRIPTNLETISLRERYKIFFISPHPVLLPLEKGLISRFLGSLRLGGFA
jgi:hypothetical protein